MRSLLFIPFMLAMSIASINGQEKSNPMLHYGLQFLGTPYLANTLDQQTSETLLINTQEVDCTTFVEYVLALSLSQGDKDDPESFSATLQQIRYRNGIIDGYASRLHYITEWIQNGIRHHFIKDITEKHSRHKLTVNLSFMSSHSSRYKPLLNDPGQINAIRIYEEKLSGQTVSYLPKDEILPQGLPWIQAGDIICLTTSIAGLDVSHVGIAIYRKGKLHLLHASSTQGKVVISSTPLNRMLDKIKTCNGIRVLRAYLLSSKDSKRTN